MSELAFINLLKERMKSRGMTYDFDDDAALLSNLPSSPDQIVSTDMLLDGVHFDSRLSPPALIGRKALAVNLSDLAACAAQPICFFLSLALPNQFRSTVFEREFVDGILTLAAEFGIALAGGDTNYWEHDLVINITVIGSAHPNGYPHRGHAQVGDVVVVTGSLGDTLSGHQFTFTPRVREARALMDHLPVHAMADISDGLATDLRHILQASKVGAVVETDLLPIRQSLVNQSLSREDTVRRAMTDGEGFGLIFCVAENDWRQFQQSLPKELQHLTMTKIGTVTEEVDFLITMNGQITPVAWHGYEHGRP